MITDLTTMAAQVQQQPPTPQELRSAYRGDTATEAMPKGFAAKRRITALVHDILVRENNFLLTGEPGLAALGITREQITPKIQAGKKLVDNPKFSPLAMTRCMPAFAQMLVLLSCEEDDLFSYDEDPTAFRRAVQKFRNSRGPQEIMDCLEGVQVELKKVHDSSGVVKADEDPDKEKKLGEI